MNQLWVWSTAVQTTSLLMIAVFFAVLARSVKLAPVRIWVGAWLCNLCALLVTVAYWYFQASIGGLIRASYMGFKAAFVLLLLFFDLDGFKQINDSLGHHVGDLCLTRFADALRECFRPSDFVVRYAGDEFVVVAPGLHEDGIGDRLARLRSLLKDAGDQGPEISFSVGTAALAPGGHPEEALRAADEAMYAVRATRPA